MGLTHRLGPVGAALAAALLTALPALAQDPPGPPGAAPPKWWEQSSLTAGSQAKWLFHVEGTFALMHAEGNTDGYSIDLKSSFDARYRRVTNRFVFDANHQDVTYGLGGGQVDAHSHTVRNQVEYDVTKRAQLVAGIEQFKDTLRFLDRRTSVYGGGGITLADSPRHKLSVVGGLGRVHFEYDRAGMMEVSPEGVALLTTTSPTSGTVIIRQGWRIGLPNRVTLTQSAELTDYFEEILGEQYGFSFSADLPLGRHFSFVPAFTVRQEENIYTDALDIKELDRTFHLGIRISY